MADDLVELGLEGADKLIDKHFHRLPDKALHSETYKHPFRKGSQDSDNNGSRSRDDRRRGDSRKQREQRRDSVWEEQESLAEEGKYTPSQREQERKSRQFDTEWDTRRDSQRAFAARSPSPRTSMAQQQYRDNNGRPLNNANSTVYTQDGPFVTPPWTTLPDYRAPAAAIHPNASQQFSPRESRQYDPSNYRPSQRRRSSSYHGPRGNNRFYSSDSDSDSDLSDSDHRHHGRGASRSHHSNNQQLTKRESQYDKTPAAYARSDRTSRSNPHQDRDVKENLKDNFTDSPQGLAGSALGAIVGGYVTHKALESRGHQPSNKDKALTLLGAVVSGVAMNAVVDKFEDRKEEKEERRRKGKEIRDERERRGERRDGRDRFNDDHGRDGRRARSERGGDRDRDYYR